VDKTKENWQKPKALFGSAGLEVRTPSTLPLKTKKIDSNELPLAHQLAITQLQEKCMLLRYSISTIKTYTLGLTLFLYHVKNTLPESITEEQIRNYLL
jgi:hypothetical protein